jgi:hypothetical protein
LVSVFYRKCKTKLGNIKAALIDGSFVVYIDTGSPVLSIPQKSLGLADENRKFLTEWK